MCRVWKLNLQMLLISEFYCKNNLFTTENNLWCLNNWKWQRDKSQIPIQKQSKTSKCSFYGRQFHLEFHDLRFNITFKILSLSNNLNYTTWTRTQKWCSVVFSFSCAHNTKVIIHIKEHPCWNVTD